MLRTESNVGFIIAKVPKLLLIDNERFKFMSRGFLILLLVFSPVSIYALEPYEVLVVANRLVPDSVDLARYYMKRRGIPKGNLVPITTTEDEACSREIYLKEILPPVRNAIVQNSKIKALVTFYGVPLKVRAPVLNKAEKKRLNSLSKKRGVLERKFADLENRKSVEGNKIKQSIKALKNEMNRLQKTDMSAAVDSELTLALKDNYPLSLWQPNPFFAGYRDLDHNRKFDREDVLFVSRIDAPTRKIVKRIIDDSLQAEQEGLNGKAYFDARYKRTLKAGIKADADAYEIYDEAIYRTVDRLKRRNIMPVIVDSKKSLFPPGSAPDTGMYCGWYSLGHYIDAFDWEKGAIGMHVASAECKSLRKGKQNFWCKRMLEDGAAAVIGPVAEPYLQAFPRPELFFTFLTDGYYTLVESYFLSQPYLSWRMILIGDPLYRPFKNKH